MCDITRPHVDSFNWMLKEGLMKAAAVRQIDIFYRIPPSSSRLFYHWNSKPRQKQELNSNLWYGIRYFSLQPTVSISSARVWRLLDRK